MEKYLGLHPFSEFQKQANDENYLQQNLGKDENCLFS
jgi:hypothetical protein